MVVAGSGAAPVQASWPAGNADGAAGMPDWPMC